MTGPMDWSRWRRKNPPPEQVGAHDAIARLREEGAPIPEQPAPRGLAKLPLALLPLNLLALLLLRLLIGDIVDGRVGFAIADAVLLAIAGLDIVIVYRAWQVSGAHHDRRR